MKFLNMDEKRWNYGEDIAGVDQEPKSQPKEMWMSLSCVDLGHIRKQYIQEFRANQTSPGHKLPISPKQISDASNGQHKSRKKKAHFPFPKTDIVQENITEVEKTNHVKLR